MGLICSIRDQIYESKGEGIKTADDFLNMRVGYYQKKLNEEFADLEQNWDDVIRKSLERCGFMTPEPHFIQAVLIGAVHQYQDLVSTYIEDIISNSEDNEYLEEFCEFISNNDIIINAWWPFDQFANLAIRTLGYLDGRGNNERTYILRIFKDYISALNGISFQHPIVKVAQRLRQADTIRYENLISHLFYNWQQPSFIDNGNSLIFISPRYIGEEYVNIGSSVYIDDHRSVFKPEDLSVPEACDFLRKFVCDVFIDNLNAKGGASEIASFCIENAIFAGNSKFNYVYFYLIFKLIETRKPEYVKIILRNFGKINWNIYTDNNANYEIATLKRFYYCCMMENGYEWEYCHKLWIEA